MQKYVMSDEEYSQRENTYRRHKEQMRQVAKLHHQIPRNIRYPMILNVFLSAAVVQWVPFCGTNPSTCSASVAT